MDFTEFLEAMEEPLYEVKGMKVECPKGTKYDKDTNTCVPVGNKTSENPNQKELTKAVGGYNVWGATGLNGDGYALAVEEGVDYEKQDKKEAEFKKADERMKYGRDGKPKAKSEKPLLPGEVRKFNKLTGKWESNKK